MTTFGNRSPRRAFAAVSAAVVRRVVTAGTLAAALVVIEVMNLPFIWLPGLATTAALAAIAATVVLGLAGTFTVLGQKPAPVLRAL